MVTIGVRVLATDVERDLILTQWEMEEAQEGQSEVCIIESRQLGGAAHPHKGSCCELVENHGKIYSDAWWDPIINYGLLVSC